ncbi:hypothetical protein LCGC14_1732120, partial [marine sediment metagenome]
MEETTIIIDGWALGILLGVQFVQFMMLLGVIM